jgi:NosR/NirI family transcriptional regulator, nitrous oxide reductase regulator
VKLVRHRENYADWFGFNEKSAHFLRVAMLLGIFVVIHLQHDRVLSSMKSGSLANVAISNVEAFFPTAAKWGDPEKHGGRQVLTSDGQLLGYAIQTSPASEPYLGFSGPSNLLVAFDASDRIKGIRILESRDTRDHVELIRNHRSFFSSWSGLTWSEAASRSEVDGVSGATLTSYAMIQGLQKRLGATQVSQKFSKALELNDVQALFPAAQSFVRHSTMDGLYEIYGEPSQRLGAILRSSPAADEVIGYQGPTETRLAIGLDGSIVGIAITDSYDNEPYVGYVRGDAWFAKILKKYSIEQWSTIDIEKERIEGVSGATMTSMAIANGVSAAAKYYKSHLRAAKANQADRVAGVWRGMGTIAMVVLGLILGLTSLRGKTYVRVAFQVLVVVFLGLINGDLLSMAMLNGWAQSGIPWQNAIGLVALTTAAVVLPIAARTNIYCSHLCPHGAVQQLLPRCWKTKSPISPWLSRALLWIRPLLITWIVLVSFLHWPFTLVDIEPFDAYSWRAAAWPTILVAVVGIVASLKIPMGYCRYGCATGALLQYLRRNSRSNRWTKADLMALVCLVVGILLYVARIPTPLN